METETQTETDRQGRTDRQRENVSISDRNGTACILNQSLPIPLCTGLCLCHCSTTLPIDNSCYLDGGSGRRLIDRKTTHLSGRSRTELNAVNVPNDSYLEDGWQLVDESADRRFTNNSATSYVPSY